MVNTLFEDVLYDVELMEYKGIQAYVRPQTSDPFVMREVFSGEYRKLNITSEDIIVDIGLNIGMFTLYALSKGAKYVVGFEAENENYQLACKNTKFNDFEERCELFNLAVVGTDPLTRNFSINLKKNKGAHSLVAKRGRNSVEVQCIKFSEIVDKYRPTIIKMDIEGGEIECFRHIDNYYDAKEIILEFHHAHLNDKDQKLQYEVVNHLKQHFKHVDFKENPKSAWVTIIHAYNYNKEN